MSLLFFSCPPSLFGFSLRVLWQQPTSGERDLLCSALLCSALFVCAHAFHRSSHAFFGCISVTLSSLLLSLSFLLLQRIFLKLESVAFSASCMFSVAKQMLDSKRLL